MCAVCTDGMSSQASLPFSGLHYLGPTRLYVLERVKNRHWLWESDKNNFCHPILERCYSPSLAFWNASFETGGEVLTVSCSFWFWIHTQADLSDFFPSRAKIKKNKKIKKRWTKDWPGKSNSSAQLSSPQTIPHYCRCCINPPDNPAVTLDPRYWNSSTWSKNSTLTPRRHLFTP